MGERALLGAETYLENKLKFLSSCLEKVKNAMVATIHCDTLIWLFQIEASVRLI